MSNVPQTANDMLDVVLYTAADIACSLYYIGDKSGANAIAILIKTLEEFKEVYLDHIPSRTEDAKSV